MKRLFQRSIPGLLMMACITPFTARADMKKLVRESCLECHDSATAKGKLSLEALSLDMSDANAATWMKCLEQVDRGFMPPPDKKQPDKGDLDAAILDLESRLIRHHAGKAPAERQTVLRRLNRVEYRNTVRDLLGLELSADPTADFPGDERSHGFTSDGEKLVTSSFLLRQQLLAVEDLVARAIHFEPKPAVQHWSMKPPFDRTTGAEVVQAAHYFSRFLKQPQPYQDICQRIGAGGAPFAGYHPLDEVSDAGVPQSGWYRLRLRVEAKYRHAFKDEYFLRWKPLWDAAEPIRLSVFTGTLQGIDPANKEIRDFTATHEQAGQRHIATWDLPDDKETWVEAVFWLDRGQFPRLGFPNGPSNSNYRLNEYFNTQAKAVLSAADYAAYEERNKKHGGWISFHFGESPRVRLHEIEFEGPLNETWPPPSHRAIFGNEPYRGEQAETVLRSFASRAWRRPVEPKEIAPLVALVRAEEKRGRSAEAAIQEGLKAVLCAPEFIYREERSDVLNAHELASRLAYFLTATMPDVPLREIAASGKLDTPETLRAEAERLLSGSRSTAFAEQFLDGWLRLHKLGSMAPDGGQFAIYFDDNLEPAMRTETQLFFRHALAANAPAISLLDSDFTFANQNLAAFYGMKADDFAKHLPQAVANLPADALRQDGLGDAPSLRFARIPLTDRRRGGLLGQAAILTLTANGVDTSPVIRGVWLLENILGTPPPPPPPDVPAIVPDIRGAKTIREQLEKHRESATCRSCHKHIDPPGFALESFDAIGRWRGHYRLGEKHVPIDPSASFHGQPFKDIVEFKTLLRSREREFARCLVEKLLLHALGRELQVTDRPHIRHILETASPSGYRLRDLVLLVCTSEPFRAK